MPLNTNVNISGGSGSSASPMVGATAGSSGSPGTVPAAAAGQQNAKLSGAGTWVEPEFGFFVAAGQVLTAGTEAYVDVTGATMALTPGTWQITYALATDHSTGPTPNVAQAVVTNSANMVVEGSQTSRPGGSTAAQVLSRTFNLTVATAGNYKLRVSNGATSGFMTLINSAAHKCTVAWTKLG